MLKILQQCRLYRFIGVFKYTSPIFAFSLSIEFVKHSTVDPREAHMKVQSVKV